MGEHIFFAPNKKKAVDYVKKVNKKEGNIWNVKSIRLRKYQIPHIDKWKSWTVKDN